MTGDAWSLDLIHARFLFYCVAYCVVSTLHPCILSETER